MTNLKVKTTSFTKSGFIQKISLGLLVVGGIFTVYTGYCWGVWGRNSLLLQFLFQCGCPLSSNEFRYPERVDVIIPACQKDNIVRLSPSGRLLFVGKDELMSNDNYILNLETGEKKYILNLSRGSIHFLNDEIAFHTFYGVDEYVLDLKTMNQYALQKFRDINSDAYFNGKVNLDVLAQSLRDDKEVFLIGDNIVVALDTSTHISRNNFFIRYLDVSGNSPNRLEEFLLVYNISFTYIPDYPEFLPQILSFNNKFIAKSDGIYLSNTNQKIEDGYPDIDRISYNPKYFSFYGWIYDNTGAIYTTEFGLCLISYWSVYSDGSSCLIKVPQPVLKLKVPQEYLDEAVP